jgi:hypothetical protein
MNDTPQQPQQATTAIGAASTLANAFIAALPPAFLVLVALNAAFLGVVMWFLSSETTQRAAVIGHIIDRCMTQQ